MGLNPDKVAHIRVGAEFLGNSCAEGIRQLAEGLVSPDTPFHVVPEFEYLQVTMQPGKKNDGGSNPAT